MGFVSILSFTHQLVKERVSPGDTAVDATAGNGVDTLFLAALVGPNGVVHAVDVQAQALRNTATRLNEALPDHRTLLHHRSHAELQSIVPTDRWGQVAAVMFNLGYLPGDDHATVTQPDSTLTALAAAAEAIRRGGIITVVLYTGHPGGKEEANAVEAWAAALPQKAYQVLQYRFFNQKNNPPYLLAIEKR
ncbi:class I SAM-dependent methyltransferase [Paenibacillus allorhizosphaerae]|uniref:Methyltransferase domain-containing protein n=1 Tax=Paenibacillus allorhizosphaerae TaxID=2849866 RepID=A0ABM8VKA6_9BACL|nr:class I SAM-dependent methyltransferase [Paenibacillus allorhizosphaerae]CAG7646794.1 hypothetical protein PAECIP111802_03833 [Paenibacillus allorhizosphaerae]